MAPGETVSTAPPRYSERLIPGPGLFIATLLVIPAVALVMIPINTSAAIPVALVVYVIITVVLLVLSPKISVTQGNLQAGRATIPVDQLGEIELLGSEGLKQAIGPGIDARSYLLVRGWIHSGVRIENIDPADPAPVWILTTRHPQKLSDAVESARGAAS